MNQSANQKSKMYNDKVVSKIWEPADSDIDAFIDEYIKLKEHGGSKSDSNYNIIESPGKKYYEQRINSMENNNGKQ